MRFVPSILVVLVCVVAIVSFLALMTWRATDLATECEARGGKPVTRDNVCIKKEALVNG